MEQIKTYTLKRVMTDEEGERIKGSFLDESYIKHPIIDHDCDGYDAEGNMLFRFRKNSLPLEVLKQGVDNFEYSIELTEGRGITSGSSHKRIRKDGSVSKITVGNKVLSGNVGFMDSNAMVPYCRMTAFGRKHFDKFKDGIPFVQYIDKLYKELCPEHYKIQKMYAEGTNQSYVIADTSFTTVTVNKNFRTALHKDSGDLEQGFGNLIAYREGDWTGGYFILPEYGVGIDLHNTDVLFVNVHKWHCNTPFYGIEKEGNKRITFVIYYREQMLACKKPSEELENIKIEKNGFFRL
jgi:hypothetical protein